MYIRMLFSHVRRKVYFRRYGRPACEVMVIVTRSSICRTQAVQILFCIDKARKRSLTEVALNIVLEENATSAIDFEWEFYSPNKNIYEQCICCVSQFFHRRFNLGTLHVARRAVRTLRSVRKVRFLNSSAEWGSLTIY